ncbi:MAG: hypothetical protein WHV66_00505 [Anaerolineales bacterium]
MYTAHFLRNVLFKAALLLIAINLAFSAFPSLEGLGRISAYNILFPGRERFPFGEDPQHSYNLSLYNLEAMFASHILDGVSKAEDEYRVLLIGDSSVWGTLLHPDQTLAGQLNALELSVCSKQVIAYNLGYPTISLLKDLMILDIAMRYQPDLIIWPFTLEAFLRNKQMGSPIVANNSIRIRNLIAKYNIKLDLNSPELVDVSLWQRTVFGRRRELADLIRLQMYGVLWAATGIDQVYPVDYVPAARDLEAKTDYHGWQPYELPADEMAFDLLENGIRIAENTPILFVNEPMLISHGKNSDIRYNFFYPRWAYDEYHSRLIALAQQKNWRLLDLWNLLPESEFTNSAIHLTPAGQAVMAQRVGEAILSHPCPW